MASASTVLADNSIHSSWQHIQDNLRATYGEAVYKSWISPVQVESLTDNQLVLSVPTRFMREWIQSNYMDTIIDYWREVDASLSVTLTVKEHVAPAHTEANITTLSVYPAPAVEVTENTGHVVPFVSKREEDPLSAALDTRFTFENFVVGKPNELAHAAARAVAESSKVLPGSNPLFLYGGVGLGKTHLMHAIAWHIRKTTPERKVVYISAEKFMYQFISSLRRKDTMSFKEQFRSVDVLMIDDVQFICGKDSTQEEFFHTFNALIDQNRQVVISCDRSPSDLDGMEERIRSRLGWGLVADIHSTNYELRLGILQSKVEQMNKDVPKEVIEFLAAKITSNVRELEGALNKVVAHSTLMGRDISLENTQDILRDLLRSNERVITVDDIQKRVAEHYNIRVADMSSARRLRSIARPRQIAMYLAKQLTSRSLLEIGRKFGGKDHTTVMHAVKRVEQLIKQDKELAEDVTLLMRMLQN